jgi:hypothetical protein
VQCIITSLVASISQSRRLSHRSNVKDECAVLGRRAQLSLVTFEALIKGGGKEANALHQNIVLIPHHYMQAFPSGPQTIGTVDIH